MKMLLLNEKTKRNQQKSKAEIVFEPAAN